MSSLKCLGSPRILILGLIFSLSLAISSNAVVAENDSAETYYKKAQSSIQSGNITGALSILSTLVDKYPTEVKGWYNLGNVYKDLKKIDEAGDCYKKALDLDPTLKGARYNWAKVRTVRGGKHFDTYGALKDFELLWADDANNFNLAYEITDLYFRRKDMPQVAKYVKEMQRIAPEKAETYYYRGLIEDYSKEFTKALGIYQEGYARNTGSNILKDIIWESNMRLGNLSLETGDNKRAYQYFKNAYELFPGNPGSYFRLGETAWLVGDNALAIEAYSHFTSARHSSWQGYNNLADVLSRDTSQIKNAIRVAQEALRWNPNAWEARDTLGWAYLRDGKPKAAEKEFQQMFNLLKLDWKVVKKSSTNQAVEVLNKLQEDTRNHVMDYLIVIKDKRAKQIQKQLNVGK